jgi:hypothetical protein
MGGMPEFERVDIDTGVNRLLVAVASDARGILAHSVSEGIRFPRMNCGCDTGEQEQGQQQRQQQRSYSDSGFHGNSFAKR